MNTTEVRRAMLVYTGKSLAWNVDTAAACVAAPDSCLSTNSRSNNPMSLWKSSWEMIQIKSFNQEWENIQPLRGVNGDKSVRQKNEKTLTPCMQILWHQHRLQHLLQWLGTMRWDDGPEGHPPDSLPPCRKNNSRGETPHPRLLKVPRLCLLNLVLF